MNSSPTSKNFHALIMAGGVGERFWPWSRRHRPKQLLPLFGHQPMIAMTVKRLLLLIPRERIWIITNISQARAMIQIMPDFPKSNFIIEPIGRDSAGAVMLGCSTIAKKDPLAIMALLPSDHLIRDTRAYLKILRGCFALASSQKHLIAIGIPPTEASTAYGYIERQGPWLKSSGVHVCKVRRFLEKPGRTTAQRFIQSKRFAWNAGMFIWSASAILEAFEKFSPIHAKGWRSLQKNTPAYLRNGFLKLPKISIDYAVMEKSRDILMVDGRFDWDDVGSWTSLHAHLPQDREGNTHQGKVISLDSRRCLILGGKRPVVTLGVDDLVIVQTDDATLICHRDAVPRIKEIVAKLDHKLL